MDIPFDLLSLRNSLLDLIDFSADSVISSLLSDHDSESLKVCEILLGFTGGKLLSPSGFLESLNNSGLIDGSFDDLRRSTTANVNLKISQRQPADWDLLSLDTYKTI
jgi:hypothetical protein